MSDTQAPAAAPTSDQLPAELPDQWADEVDAVMDLSDAALLARVRNVADPLHTLLVEELAARYEDATHDINAMGCDQVGRKGIAA